MERKIVTRIPLNRKVAIAAFLLLQLLTHHSYAQEKSLRVYPTLGTSLRFGIMNFFNFNPILTDNYTRPYTVANNINGFSLNPGLVTHYTHFELEYFSGLRYDDVYYLFGSNNKYSKTFLLDHNFNLSLQRKFAYGIGLSIVNSNKGYWYIDNFNNPIPKYHNIEFKTVNVFLQVPVWKILNLEIKALYMPNGYPYNRNEKYIMYSLRLFYRFNFLNNRIKKELQNETAP